MERTPPTPVQQFATALLGDRRLIHALVLVVAAGLVPAHLTTQKPSLVSHVLPIPPPSAAAAPGAPRDAAAAPGPVALTPEHQERNTAQPDPIPKLDLDHASAAELQQALEANRSQQARVRSDLAAGSAQIESLNQRVQQLDAQIEATAQRIDVERRQARALARAIYAQPSSVAVALAQSDNLGDFLTRTADLGAANSRAHEIANALAGDQKRLQAEEAGVTAARDQQVTARHDLESRLASFQQMEQRELDLIAAWQRQAQLQARVAAGPAYIQDLIRQAFLPLGEGAVTWALRIAACESNFHPDSVNSSSGAMGLFQFLPSTWAHSPYAGQDAFDPRINALAAAWLYQRSGPGQWVCQ